MFDPWLLSMKLCCLCCCLFVIVAIVLLLLRFLSLLLYSILLTRAGSVSGSMLPSQEISTIDKKERWREGEGGVVAGGGRGRGMTCPARQRFRWHNVTVSKSPSPQMALFFQSGSTCRARIFKRLWSPGIDSKEWIPPAYVAHDTPIPTWFLAPIDCLKIPAQSVCIAPA